MKLRTLIFTLAAGLALAACSGGYSFTGASIPPEAKTIAVATFPNYASTVNPQLSQTLTEELRNMFASQTSLNVVNGEGDMEVSGSITAYGTRASAISSGDEVAMNRLSITIKVKFVNNVDPNANFEQSFTRYRDYNAQLNFSSVESSLVSEIVTELCEDVFNKSVVNW
ncbi:MAG: LPS assembly lipoprotein LptE [Bacteroidales bacterium]|nr:LPS assembly lipoprotein LptE [Bacteroidales bacterium]